MRVILPKTAVAAACAGLMLSSTLHTVKGAAIQDAATEVLLNGVGGGGDPGRMWPGFAAVEGVDTGAVGVDTGAVSMDGQGVARSAMALSIPGVSSLSGGDLSSAIGGTGVGTTATSALSSLGSQAGSLLSGVSGAASGVGSAANGLSSLSGVTGALGTAAGLSSLASGNGTDLLSLLGIVSGVSALSSLPQLITSLPQQVGSLLQGLGTMITSLAQAPQYLGGVLGSLYEGVLGSLGSLLQGAGNLLGGNYNNMLANATNGLNGAVGNAANSVTGAMGGVAGSTPYSAGTGNVALTPNQNFSYATGGEGGNWGGTSPLLGGLVGDYSDSFSSLKRGTYSTASGYMSDHYNGNNLASAVDIAGTPGDGVTSARASAIVSKLGGPSNWGDTGGNYRTVIDGYRYQVIWKSNVGGNHYNHIHVGVKKVN